MFHLWLSKSGNLSFPLPNRRKATDNPVYVIRTWVREYVDTDMNEVSDMDTARQSEEKQLTYATPIPYLHRCRHNRTWV